jgi:single-stranded DNA-binding protein
MDQNHCMFVGRLAAKPILSQYDKKDANGEKTGVKGNRVFFRLMVCHLADRGKPRTEQHSNAIPIVAWDDPAVQHAKYLDTGTEVTIMGELIVEANKNKDGTYNPDHWNIRGWDIQYGQASMKNASFEMLTARQAAITARLDELAAGGQVGGAPSESVPAASLPNPSVANPLTKDGAAPLSMTVG